MAFEIGIGFIFGMSIGFEIVPEEECTHYVLDIVILRLLLTVH
jgi:uncharacterized membrane protein (Fun14 family)